MSSSSDQQSPANESDELLLEAPACVGILFHLPEHLQTAEVLKALICADAFGYLRRDRELGAEALANIRLSSSRVQ